MAQLFKENVESVELTQAAESHYVNIKLTTDNVADYKPRYGLKVMDNVHENVTAILDKMASTGNTTALNIKVTNVRLGADYHNEDHVEDAELDALMGTKKKIAPLFQNQKKKSLEPVMFWINYELSTPYAKDEKGEDVVIRTDATSITSKAPKQLLSDLLKASKEEMELLAEIEVVRDANPVHVVTLVGNLDDIV